MKNVLKIALLAQALFFFGCNIESVELSDDQVSTEKKSSKNKDNVDVDESKVLINNTEEEYCYSTGLIAGQHHEIGTVTVNVEGDVLRVTYTIFEDWVLEATHLHITNCAEGGFPTTGANNPKIGHFEYTNQHEDGITQVSYVIEIEEITGELCFAAHAEVDGPSKETAWAAGEDFGGNSWAMYFKVDLTDCYDEDTPPSFG